MSVKRTSYCAVLGLACLAIILTGCSGQTRPAGAPDPFSSVAQQADEAYVQGVALYQQGRLRESLEAFKRAKLLSPADDPRIDEMIQRASAELTPTPTEVPATATPTLEPTPIVQSSATPITELGNDYFGNVFLTVVPGRDGVPSPMAQFSFQDQIGLYIERLDQRLRMPLHVRIFGLESGRLVQDARGDALRRFQDRLVWYHEGGEPPGLYRIELYAGDAGDAAGETLTHVFEYAVGTSPVPIPTPVPTATPVVFAEPAAYPPAPAPVGTPAAAAPPVPQPRPAAPVAPQPIAAPPTSTPPPTIAAAIRMFVTAGPAALDLLDTLDQLFVADRSGQVWSLEHGQPALKRPFAVAGDPVGLAADPATGRLYVALRSQPALVALDATTGRQLARVALPVDPGDVRLDSSLGSLFLIAPERDALDVVDVQDLKVVRSISGLPQVTGIALDRETHTLYLSHLDGQMSVVDGQTGTLATRISLSAEGLSGVATANGRVFAINTPGRELLEVDPATGDVRHMPLGAEPEAIVVGPQTGAVYVLDRASNTIVQLDPAGGSQIAHLFVGDVGPSTSSQLRPETMWLRPRMVVNPIDERIYVIEPEAATLALSP